MNSRISKELIEFWKCQKNRPQYQNNGPTYERTDKEWLGTEGDFSDDGNDVSG